MFRPLMLGVAAALALAACGKAGDPAAATTNAAEAAGDKTIGAALSNESKFAAAVEAAGLQATLAGPGPYTVLAPIDDAFEKLPAGALDALMKPEGRAELTALLSHHVLPGTILAADIGKAIDSGGGKALIATMGGGTLTATRSGDKILFADAVGTRALVTAGDQQRSNGVVHSVDAVLMPTK